MDFEQDYHYDEFERDWDESYEPECVTDCDPSEHDEDDGQPDELTEWMDFDPDC